jgi:selenide,water dikinase
VRAATPPVRDLVLLGGGHSHIQVLKAFGMRPMAGVRLTLVCREVLTPYSGMLPGHVAGYYDRRATHIDLGPLTRFAGARLIVDEAVELDPVAGRIELRERPQLRFDVLSINTGAVPGQSVAWGTPVKPIGRFLPQWDAVRAAAQPGEIVAVVGGGAGGVELALAMRAALPRTIAVRVVTDDLLPETGAKLRARASRALARAGVELCERFHVVAARPGEVLAGDGRAMRVDHLFWVTRVIAPAWPRAAGLATDAEGFVLVDRHLRSVSHPRVFAAGDVAALDGRPRPKAGVFAVRAGPVLAENLRRVFRGERLQAFRPQRRYLALIGTGDGRALASRGAWSAEGAWAWRWKDWIDRRFMQRFTELPDQAAMNASAPRREAELPPPLARELPDGERCGGCAAKLGAEPLGRVLARLPDQSRADVPVGIGDDAAVLVVPGGRMLLTVDGFRSLVDDPWRFGRIVAHHSLNDVLAMGGRPTAALAMATIPLMAEAMMEEDLYGLLRGAVEVLNAHGVALIGGHSTEGAELSLALTVTGVEGNRLFGKAGLRPGDRLVLTKPLGTGTLLAGFMRGRARSDDVELAVRSMDTSNAPALAVLERFAVSALTDVTGFGLLGHLSEMLRASATGARVDAAALPALPGALELLAAGVTSSLHRTNLSSVAGFAVADGVTPARLALLVDPQTSGGLLAGVPAAAAAGCVLALVEAGYPDACVIGEVTARERLVVPQAACG